MLQLCIFLNLAWHLRALDSFIVGGVYAPIKKYPHSAALSLTFDSEDGEERVAGCGASILNQIILLSAAHCFFAEEGGPKEVIVNMGSKNKLRGVQRTAVNWIVHEKYDPHIFMHDIAIVKMSHPVELDGTISRVALMKLPPHNEPAQLAGWGETDIDEPAEAMELKSIDMSIWTQEDCLDFYPIMRYGVLCGSSNVTTDFMWSGDSGSAIVVRGYIQVGVVNFILDPPDPPVMFFADLRYYYHWIKRALKVLCEE